MKSTFIYCLSSPLAESHIRYIGKSDDPQKARSSYLSSSKENSKNYKPTPLSYWINSLTENGLVPSVKVIEEVDYDYDCQWGDRVTHYISKYLLEGHLLENATIGGPSPWPQNYVELRKQIMQNDETEYTTFKYEEEKMCADASSLNCGIETAWKLKRDFWSKYSDTSSVLKLMIAKSDYFWLKMRRLGMDKCLICGTSINIDALHKVLQVIEKIEPDIEMYTFPKYFRDSEIISLDCSEYSNGICYTDDFHRMVGKCFNKGKYTGQKILTTPDSKYLVCTCNKAYKIYIRNSCVTRKIQTSDYVWETLNRDYYLIN